MTSPRMHTASARTATTRWLIACAACALLPGCAAVTNPVANGVPVHLLPEELLAESREGFEQIPLTLLRQPPPESYVLATGDILGVFIEGIVGGENTPPPINIPDSAELPTPGSCRLRSATPSRFVPTERCHCPMSAPSRWLA
jgi:hypothetical protein